MKRQPALLIKFFLVLSIVEGIIVAIVLLSIPGDPKNAFLFGYSKSRLALLVAVLLILAALATLIANRRIRQVLLNLVPAPSGRLQNTLPWLGGGFCLLLWLTVWMPAYRLEELAATFTRLQPVLIWLELLLIQWVLFLWLATSNPVSMEYPAEKQAAFRIKPVWVVAFASITVVFLGFALFSGEYPGSQLYFPPGAPLSAVQVLLVWIVFFLLYRFQRSSRASSKIQRVFVVLAFLAIWAITFLAWSAAPLACTDDRPGPFPPNDVCYPHVNDAVYSIGSHYITLGQGVYNHWLTDKPLYMAFLALGQAVAGPGIEDYLRFQVAIIALIPALLFLAGRSTFGSALGFTLALLTALQGFYSIALYRAVGSVNARLENPEVVTALALLGLGFAVFKWLRSNTDIKWAILSGAYFGDRNSPTSSSALLVSTMTGTDLYGNLARMLKTGMPAFFVACLLFLAISPVYPLAAVDQTFVASLPEYFRISIWNLAPLAVLIVFIFLRVKIRYAMLFSCICAFFVALFVQRFPLGTIGQAILTGFQLSGAGRVPQVIRGGGITFMFNAMTIVIASLGCTQTLAIIMNTHLLSKPYAELGKTKEDLALDIEDTVVVLAALIPWNVAGAIPLKMLDAPLSALLFAFFMWTLPVLRLASLGLRRRRQTRRPGSAAGNAEL